MNAVPAIGHNSNAPIADLLADSYRALLGEVEQATAAADRAPAIIENDEISGKVTDLVADLRKLKKQADDGHAAEKAPYLQAGKDVDTFFRAPRELCEAAIKTLLSKQGVYLHAKELAAKAAAAKAEAEAREKADAALREAERAQDQGDFDGAQPALERGAQAEEVAQAATATLAAKPADRTRTFSQHGNVTSLRMKWTFAVEDRAALDLEALRPYLSATEVDKAIRNYIKAGGRKLIGCKIFEQPKAR